ncbi:hypothetical protein SDRG_02928 [Saprolegnia diclina VS20]|uniref:Tyrosinase copper-binding domain-containing protein n=1 Tax=Saprolegnia diclina (strain VS20) TaxID=1156394 RepID=T0S9R0_SAPDV|nr:hypothetical protein SDRG_02928 [Saprolegnia diclina VS20]EQC39487.1 hypothetical protein SDRG_02928 [Saprolegnia diclina VS20]|eukprot:XP_008606759.1 hypothetical protein SDRG_02928 [Saprolegnia diclina VS20]
MAYYKLLLAAIFCILGVSALEASSNTTSSVAGAKCGKAYGCCGTRVRKSWDALDADEKATFKSAVALAMDKGLYERFVSMHREILSHASSHNTCGFLFWHRQYLLGFENMLRSLKPEFACLTLPYYDFVNDNVKSLAGECKDIASCSSIVNELGSATPSIWPQVSLINGFPVPGRCDKAAPLNHYCQWQNPSSILCSRCVPRGPYHLTRFPCSVTPTNLRRILFKSASFGDLNRRLEWGPSLFMHFHLLGALANPWVGPSDPLFFALHATIDALHTMYYNCRVRPLELDDAAKQSNPLVFEGCKIGGIFPITSTSNVKMNAITNGLSVVDVRSPAQITSPFFKDIPNKMYQLADTTDLGDNSYEYEFTGPLQVLAETPCAVVQSESNITEIAAPNKATDVYFKWRAALAAQCTLQGLSSLQCDIEIEKVLVLYYHNCVAGGAVDLSASFKLEWGISALTDQLASLQALLTGKASIALEAFGNINEQFFKCRGDTY